MFYKYSNLEKLNLVLFTALLVMGLLSSMQKLGKEQTPTTVTRTAIIALLVPIQFAILVQH